MPGISILEHQNTTNRFDWFIEFVEDKSQSDTDILGDSDDRLHYVNFRRKRQCSN
jgi:hypothetical protein